jgi:hypothetical protein
MQRQGVYTLRDGSDAGNSRRNWKLTQSDDPVGYPQPWNFTDYAAITR